MKKYLLFLSAFLALFLFCGCPEHPEEASADPALPTCTITILCDTAVASPDCDPDVLAILPADGCILPETECTFSDGDTVFELLKSICRERKIHFEFTETPLYHSAYLEGIANLYEFDCGSLSGWMYAVNGVYPPLGCSRYPLSAGDRVVIRYTCTLGEDIGGDYASQTADTPA